SFSLPFAPQGRREGEMSIAAMTMLAAIVGMAAQASARGKAEDKSVSVCVENSAGFSIFPLARQTASKMFSEGGVTMDWHRGLVGCPAEGIRISLSSEVPADVPPEALAYALPYEGSHIVIFYDRLQQKVKPAQMSQLLAHVLVHEVTHILQGIHRHS